MRPTRILSEKVAEPPPGLWSNCVKVGNQIILAGLVAMDETGGIVGEENSHRQAEFIFETMRSYVESAGGQMSDIATMTIFLTDMTYRPGVLSARRQFFNGDFPCSTLVAVTSLIDPRLLVEINATAFLG